MLLIRQSAAERMFALDLGAPVVPNESPPDDRLRTACRSFEGFLVGEMLKQMRPTTTGGGGILPQSRGEAIFFRQQCEALGDILAAREPLGIARMLQQSVLAQSGQHGRQEP